MKNTKSFWGLAALWLTIIALSLTGCDILLKDNNPTVTSVTSVTVSPASANVAKGATAVFTATVSGNNSPASTVTWAVSGGKAGTGISSSGVLTVAANETATTLTVTATSTQDTRKTSSATVAVSPGDTVTSVTVSPNTVSLVKGGTQTFTATVSGTNSPAQTVTWSVSGGGTGTSISAGGVLSIATGETATTLTVRATSTEDTTKSGTAVVTVTETHQFIFVNQSSYTLKFEIESGSGWTPAEFTLLPSNSQIVSTMESVTSIGYLYSPGSLVTHTSNNNTLTFFDK
jgi:hypothetical protein